MTEPRCSRCHKRLRFARDPRDGYTRMWERADDGDHVIRLTNDGDRAWPVKDANPRDEEQRYARHMDRCRPKRTG